MPRGPNPTSRVHKPAEAITEQLSTLVLGKLLPTDIGDFPATEAKA